MNNDTEEMVRRLSFENWIWFGFIVISALDIYGDELLKKGLKSGDRQAFTKANKLFLNLAYFTIIIYIYFLIRNYHDYKKHPNKIYQIRLLGSIFLILGTLCLIYFQKNNMSSEESPSNI